MEDQDCKAERACCIASASVIADRYRTKIAFAPDLVFGKAKPTINFFALPSEVAAILSSVIPEFTTKRKHSKADDRLSALAVFLDGYRHYFRRLRSRARMMAWRQRVESRQYNMALTICSPDHMSPHGSLKRAQTHQERLCSILGKRTLRRQYPTSTLSEVNCGHKSAWQHQ